MYVPLYRLRIKTHMLYKQPCIVLSRDMVAARTNSKGDICVPLCQLLVSAGGAGPSQTPSIAKRRRRLRAGTSVLIGEGPLRISKKYSRGRWQQ